MTKRRVVVTGMGAVTPLGLDVESTWEAIVAGKSGVHQIEAFDTSDFSVKICASVQGFDPSAEISSKELRRLDTFIQYGIIAASQAFTDSGLVVDESNAERMGVTVGSGIGGLPYIVKNSDACNANGPRKVSPFFITGGIINMVAGNIAIRHNLKGPNLSAVSACATSAHNIIVGSRFIQSGDADVMVVGGTEMATIPLGIGGFSSMRALSTRNDQPKKASRPWDKNRDGFVLADGAGVLVLEEYEHAMKRNAHIYGELVGVGMSGDAYHITTPDKGGASRAVAGALKDAQLNPEEVDYINAHATSTPVGDELEALAIKLSFGDHHKKLAMSSTKSMTGHLLGAAGGVEAIFSLLALRDQVAPPTINLDDPDEACLGINCVPHTAQSMKINVSLCNSFGFGGTNASLVFRHV